LSQSTSLARGAANPATEGEALALRNPLEPVPLRTTQPGTAMAARQSQRVRRSHVLAAVRRLIADVGCENVTVRGIAETSGYAVQTVYNLVGPRDEAISAAISEYSIFVGRTAAPDDGDPCTIPAIAERWMEAIALNPEFVRQSNILFFTASRHIYYRFRDRQIRGLYNLLRPEGVRHHPRACRPARAGGAARPVRQRDVHRLGRSPLPARGAAREAVRRAGRYAGRKPGTSAPREAARVDRADANSVVGNELRDINFAA